ncbi:MAG: HAD family hydrolase [Desulfobulbaceae bacterium]|nr:HAD family hydrolase [Desulfobulbaceae bacterium]
MRYQAVLFDLDGTLLDTLTDLAEAGNRVLARLGLKPHPTQDYRYFVGNGMRHLMECILPRPLREQEEALEAAMVAFQQEYAKTWQVHTKPYAGIAELLDYLSAKGCPMGILSNKPQSFTQLCVDKLLAAWRFHPVLGQREGIPRKPHPAGALETARILGLAPSSILYVGDTGVDMRTAQQAGMDAVGVLWGFRDAEELRATGAETVVQAPEELVRIIAASNTSAE